MIGTSTDSRIIGADQIPDKLRSVGEWASLDDCMRETRRSYIAKVLRACRSDRAIAARVLGITEAELD